MKAAYGKKHQDRKKRAENTSRFISIYIGISVMVLHELWEFGEGRLVKYINTINEMISEGLDNYAERGDTERVQAVGNLYYASRRDLTDVGVEIEKIDSEFAPVSPEGWKCTPFTRGNPIERRAYLDSMDLVVAPIWYLSALYLNETYRFGKIKMGRYYSRCRERYAEFCNYFLKCSIEGDVYCSHYLDDLTKKCLALGVEI